MIVASPILMGAPPPRPLTDESGRGGSGPDKTGEQVTDFAGGQGNDGWGSHGHASRFGRRQRRVLLEADTDQKSRGQHDQGDVPVPAQVAADLGLIQSEIFVGLQILLNMPARPNG